MGMSEIMSEHERVSARACAGMHEYGITAASH